jgi:hypothetical protein
MGAISRDEICDGRGRWPMCHTQRDDRRGRPTGPLRRPRRPHEPDVRTTHRVKRDISRYLRLVHAMREHIQQTCAFSPTLFASPGAVKPSEFRCDSYSTSSAPGATECSMGERGRDCGGDSVPPWLSIGLRSFRFPRGATAEGRAWRFTTCSTQRGKGVECELRRTSALSVLVCCG